MSLYGALSSGVSGLRAQANRIGILSDNISNVNTVGYKRGEGVFETLVTSSGTVAYAPGGVLGTNRKQVSEQGLLVTTNSNTDIAISGKGMMVVNGNADGSGTVYYTRAGSFKQDSTGNFQNAAGYFLQGWPLDREGRLPGEAGNANTTSRASLSSLETVNVESLSGSAASTTRIELSANLKSTEVGYPGSGVTVDMDNLSVQNFDISSTDIIVPTSVNDLERGDQFKITTGGGLDYTYRYGGFTFSRDITTGAVGDSATAVDLATLTLGNNPFYTTPGSKTVTVRQGNHGLQTGDVVTFSGLSTALAGIPASDFNQSFVITKVDEDSYTVQVDTAAQVVSTVPSATSMVSNNAPSGGPASVTMTLPSGHGFLAGQRVTIAGATGFDNITAGELNSTYTISAVTSTSITFTIPTIAGDPAGAVTGGGAAANAQLANGGSTTVNADIRIYAGTIFDATTASTTFFGATGTTGFTTGALNFTVTTPITGTHTFVYTTGTPNTQLGQFNTLNTLATAINAVDGLTARVSNNRLYVGSLDANEAITFGNGDDTGSGSGNSIKRGIDWVGELGLKAVAAGNNRFSTMQGLAAVVNESPGVSATIANPDTSSTMNIYVDDPLDTVTFSDNPVSTVTTTFTSSNTLTTAVGSSEIDIVQTAHGYTKGDIITLDPTGIAIYPSATTAINAYATVSDSSTVTITQASHGFTTGDQIYFDGSNLTGYPTGNINGIPLTELTGLYSVTVTGANTYTIAVNSRATSTGNGGTGTFIASPTIGGIPLTALNGQFEVADVSSTGQYSIRVPFTATTAVAGTAVGLDIQDPTNSGSVVSELGMTDSLNSLGFTIEQTTGALGPAYDATDADKNMASGAITPQYFTSVRIFDSQGTGHDLRVAFIKTGINTWASEIYAIPAGDVPSSFANGQVAHGTLVFNGDGTLNSVDAELAAAISVAWTNGATPSSVTMDWGTAGTIGTGLTDGLSQFDAAYKLNFANQNGVPVGELIGVEISATGIVTARFSNGESQDIFKIPLADFANFDGLEQATGNVFAESNDSGAVNLREAGESGTGKIQSSTLESSNADVAQQLTDMIIAQRAYQANTKIITTADSLLEELSRIIQ